MVRNRTGLAPWSLSREAGIESATVDGTIEVPQTVQPVLDTGFVDEDGNWKGTKSSDSQFIIYTDEAIANAGTILTPSVNADGTWPLDMTGFKDIFFALRPSNGGTYKIEAVMGPDALSFANLNPVDPGRRLRIQNDAYDAGSPAFADVVNDEETCYTDVWNIFYIPLRSRNQKLLQFQVTNSSGGISTIDTAFMRIV